MLATLTNPGDFVKLTQSDPFHFVTKMLNWVEDISGAGTLKREFRWGTTNRVRASWMDLTVDNLQKIILDPNEPLFVDFRYTLLAGGPMTINDVYLEYDQAPDAGDKFWGYRPPMLVSERGNISNLMKVANFSFKPYQVNPAVVLYKELSYTINKLFGHDVMYARAVPMAIGKDVTLHEWTLYDVDDPCCVKVLVPNNEFPDSKITFNPMGLDFEMPFEIHIVKAYFEEIFGVGTAPQKRDILFFPLTNRVYEIESSYLWKDIMQREVYWKVSLKKYQPKANRYEPQDLREGLDAITFGMEEQFGEEVKEEAIKITKPQQYDPKIGSRDYDPIRENINDDLVISQEPFKNYNLTLSESQYDLRSIFAVTNNPTAVTYKAFVDFPLTEERKVLLPVCEGSLETKEEIIVTDTERSLTGWFRTIKPKVSLPKDPVRGQLQKGSPGPTTTPVSFVIAPIRNYAPGDLVRLTRFNGFTAYGTFLSKTPINGGFVITIEIRNDVIAFLDVYYPGWAGPSTTSGYIFERTFETIFMDGYDDASNSGWKLSMYADRYFVFKSETEDILFILPNNLIEGSWYAFFLNINNYYRQVSLDLWVRKWLETEITPQQTSNLENIYSKTEITVPIDRSGIGGTLKYSLPASNVVYTNIRLFDRTENELLKQMDILNQTIVQDTQYAIIIDNAVPRLNLPWIGKTK
jgi:hypothetical protein